MIRRLALLLALAAITLLAACGDSDGDWAPAPIFEGTDGASLFAQACSECHGTDLTGTDKGPPLLHDFYRPGHHSDAAFFAAISRGARQHHWNFGNMDPLPSLSQSQAEAIVAYVRETQRAAGFD